MDLAITVGLAGREVVRRQFEEICQLYDQVFAAPPFAWQPEESGRHRGRLNGLLYELSFGAALAHQTGELVGFAYGFMLKPGTSWWSGITPELPVEQTREWPDRTFVLYDFGVRADLRGAGVGHALHDLLLGSRKEQRATLATHPDAVGTKRIYERWGWYRIGVAAGGPDCVADSFDIYRRDSLEDLASRKRNGTV